MRREGQQEVRRPGQRSAGTSSRPSQATRVRGSRPSAKDKDSSQAESGAVHVDRCVVAWRAVMRY
jgi:hypothetical protein